jgi:hypothetical protein
MNSRKKLQMIQAAVQMLDGLKEGYRDMATVRVAASVILKAIPSDAAKCSVPRLKKRLMS